MSENLREQLLLLPDYFQGHLILTMIALSLGIITSLPLGIWAAQSPRVKRPLLVLVSIIQTFPSVAILALVVAMLGGQIGMVPAVIALVLYSMLPIVRNTVTGLETVPTEVVEAAKGIGMSSSQILMRVRLPLALPVIIAGIRIAAVWTVGLATLSTLVGATSFGNYIFTGLQIRNLVAVTVGSLAAALMAILLDSLIASVQWLVENRNQPGDIKKYNQIKTAVTVASMAFISFSIYSFLPAAKTDFIIGSKGFTEQHIIAGLFAAELENAGFEVDQRLGLGSEVIYSATANGAVDVYLEYTGTVWANRMNESGNPGRELIKKEVFNYIENKDGMVGVGTLGFQNLYALAMKKDRAEELGVDTIEDIVPIARSLTAAGDLEFFGRPEWVALREMYDIDFAQKLTFDPALMYTAVDDQQVDIIAAYTSDGRVAAYNLKILDDPRNAFLPYDGFIIASSTAAENDVFVQTMESLVDNISDEEMREANKIVDVDGGSISDAVQYLQGAIQ
ncbi:MAG: ABC transporter permease/substrate-binding protein [Gammaproteobacteria bacterium]|nr:ABC transporter permease/substrate-binding protein [Gammaproteobacteria bacterium]